MDHQALRAYCLSRKGAVEDFPFGEDTIVYKIMGKMFALLPARPARDEPPIISLKCDPTLALLLRQTYDAVQPGYHLNKSHWNTITVDGSIPYSEIEEMIDHSYGLVVKGLKKIERDQLAQMG